MKTVVELWQLCAGLVLLTAWVVKLHIQVTTNKKVGESMSQDIANNKTKADGDWRSNEKAIQVFEKSLEQRFAGSKAEREKSISEVYEKITESDNERRRSISEVYQKIEQTIRPIERSLSHTDKEMALIKKELKHVGDNLISIRDAMSAGFDRIEKVLEKISA